MRNRVPITAFVLLLAALWVGLPPAAHAQGNVRTLSIRNGKVILDGRELPRRGLPAGLQVEGLQYDFSFTGVENPVVSLNGQLYALGRGQLVHYGAPLTFHAPATARAVAPSAAPPLRAGVEAASPSKPGEVQVWTGVRPSLPAVQAEQMLERYGQRVYMSGLRERDRGLFEQLTRERELEQASLELAAQARSARTPADRRKAEEALRKQLAEIFELKQQNRRGEIEQLESSLEELQTRLREREKLRARIIESRLRELLGAENPSAW